MTTLDFHQVSDAVNALGGKVIGIQGSGGGQTLTDEMTQFCKETGSLGANNQPLVYQGADANAGPAIAQGVRDLAAGMPLDMRALLHFHARTLRRALPHDVILWEGVVHLIGDFHSQASRGKQGLRVSRLQADELGDFYLASEHGHADRRDST